MLFASPIPRPEYPRPERQRGRVEGVDWLNLNGPWDFRFDPDRKGIDEGWFKPEATHWPDQITVPFCWESLVAWNEGDAASNENYFSTRVFRDPASVTHQNHRSAPRYEVGWYAREVRVPQGPEWDGKRIIVTVGAADYFIEGWCNGTSIGKQESGYIPVEFDITDALETTADGRRGRIVFRVEDPMDNAEQPVGKQWGWYTPTSGIWQTVFVEPRSRSYIDHFKVIPDIDAEEVEFTFACAGTRVASIVADITAPDGRSLTASFEVKDNIAGGRVKLRDALLWEPRNPHLYRVKFSLRTDDEVSDVIRSYFGMRKINTTPSGSPNAPARICLNNKPIYLRGALYQSYFPDGVYTARHLKTIEDDVTFARNSGFDFLRVHIKLDDPLLLYYADTVGMLLMQDFPNFGEGGDTPLGRRRFEQMMKAGMQRDFNHPSIIAWCLFNETWGFGGQNELMKFIAPDLGKKLARPDANKVPNSSSFQWVHEMWRLAKTLDPTRMIEDMSVVVWEHLAAYGHVDTDINSWHFYIDDYQRAKDHIAEVVAKTFPGSTHNYIAGYAQKDAPLINSEYGGVGALDGDRDISWTFKFLTNELRLHDPLSAYIFTQLTDVEWEYNGLLNYDRSPKELGYPPTLINQGDVLPLDAAPISRVEPGSTVTVDVYTSHFARLERKGVTLHWNYSAIDSLGHIHSHLVKGWAEVPFTQFKVERVKSVQITLPPQTALGTLWVFAVTETGETVASNFIKHFVSNGPLPEREERDGRLILRQRVDRWSYATWSQGGCDRAEAKRTGKCFGRGAGFFEWAFGSSALDALRRAGRVQILLEVSSCRPGNAQTDGDTFPSVCRVSLNGVALLQSTLPNHPHDSRGSLSYLAGDKGAYGYLTRVTVEGEALQRLLADGPGDLVLRVEAVGESATSGGLTIYGEASGRYPIAPTLVIEGISQHS